MSDDDTTTVRATEDPVVLALRQYREDTGKSQRNVIDTAITDHLEELGGDVETLAERWKERRDQNSGGGDEQ